MGLVACAIFAASVLSNLALAQLPGQAYIVTINGSVTTIIEPLDAPAATFTGTDSLGLPTSVETTEPVTATTTPVALSLSQLIGASSATGVTSASASLSSTGPASSTAFGFETITLGGAPSATGSVSSSASTRTSATSSDLEATPTSSSTSAPETRANSSAASGLSFSAKVGIGLGVPLGVIILAIFGFFVLRHQRNRQSRLGGPENAAAATATHPANDEQGKRLGPGEAGGNLTTPRSHDRPHGLNQNAHEIHEPDLPPYSREAPGSPGVWKQELPA